MDLGDAKKGDRTMLDALIPAIDAVQQAAESGKNLQEVCIFFAFFVSFLLHLLFSFFSYFVLFPLPFISYIFFSQLL